jgi:AcrR family transcriptional regulator
VTQFLLGEEDFYSSRQSVGVTVERQEDGSARPDGLRERKKQRTRAQLQRAAIDLFTERGYDAVTVDDIAAAVEVSARTFFRHFGSKDDVLMSFEREQLATLRTLLAERPADESPLMAVRHAVVALAQAYADRQDETFLRLQLMAATPSLLGRAMEIQQQWELVLAEAVADRLGVSLADDLRPALVGACAVAALRVATQAWLASGGKEDVTTMADNALLLIAGGGDATRWATGEGMRSAST